MWLHPLERGLLFLAGPIHLIVFQFWNSGMLLFPWVLMSGSVTYSKALLLLTVERTMEPKFHRPVSAIPKEVGVMSALVTHSQPLNWIITTSDLSFWCLLVGQKHGEDPGSTWPRAAIRRPILPCAWLCRTCKNITEAWADRRKGELHFPKWHWKVC